MKKNTEKLTETKLTITLRTGLMHSNKREEAHMQNDYTSYYIGAINYFIRGALEAENLLQQQTESKVFVNDGLFRENMQFLIQISEALAEWLPDYSSAMHNEVFGMNETETADNKSVSNTAKQVSDLLNNPDLPEPIKTDAECENRQTEPTAQPINESLTEHHLQILANKISHVLKSDRVSGDAKDAFRSIIVDASNETKTNVGVDSPEIIKISLPLLIKSLDFNFGRGVVQSLHSLLDSSLVYGIEDELRQYEKRFDGRTEDELKVLDLSNLSVEDLAKTLSGIMHNPNLPKNIYDCLTDYSAKNG